MFQNLSAAVRVFSSSCKRYCYRRNSFNINAKVNCILTRQHSLNFQVGLAPVRYHSLTVADDLTLRLNFTGKVRIFRTPIKCTTDSNIYYIFGF